MSTSTSLSTAPARGMRDFLPQETLLRDWAINRLINTYQQFGFTRIETPAVENIAQLKQSEGGENLSLIFEILKRGDKLEKALANPNANAQELIDQLSDLGLRFDLTVPLVRFLPTIKLSFPILLSLFKLVLSGVPKVPKPVVIANLLNVILILSASNPKLPKWN